MKEICGKPLRINMPEFLLLLDGTLILLCFLIFYQDLRERAVSLLLFIGCLVLAGTKYGLAEIGFLPLLFNSLFIVMQLLVVAMYCRIRYRSFNLFRFIGAGDVLCWAVLALLFSPINFIVFFVGSLIASFALFLLFNRLRQEFVFSTIPLAGFQSLLLILVLVFCHFNSVWQPYNDISLLTRLGLL